jgi:dTDP-4-dehydrorhamnose 3,5-epimerase
MSDRQTDRPYQRRIVRADSGEALSEAVEDAVALDILAPRHDLDVEPEGTRDEVTVDGSGQLVSLGIEGVMIQDLKWHVDQRGALADLKIPDLDSDFWKEPVVHAVCVTIRRGRIKGWAMHKLQADRYFIASGNLRTALYDGRKRSPTFGHTRQFYFSDAPALLRIPAGVWHANQNMGEEDVVMVNFPTQPFNHADPDKYRIDPHSGAIPFDWTLRDG